MTVSSSTSAPAVSYADVASASSTVRTAKKTLGQEDFLKLLATQFQVQDPMKPIEDTAFIAQMAQFTSLEQSSAMTTQMKQLKNGQDIVTANSYIGHQLTFDLGTGKTATGTVTGVELNGGTPRILVGDTSYALFSVLLVEPAPAGSTPVAPAPAGS